MLLAGGTSCANPGSGPDGGPYDETPPRILQTTPLLGAQNHHQAKVTLTFDEFVKLENAAEKIIVSPPQIETPEIKTLGRKISVELLDSLHENTTYTIDFSDAITDNNEGNPMGHFTFYFSTGNRLDTMEVSGHVLTANDLEPVKGILVGLHSDTTDTAFTSLPFQRVARTDGNGRFVIKGIAPGNYRIYALKDMDGDFKMAPGEELAFSRQLITPSSFLDLRYDTLWTDTLRYDTIVPVNFTHYLPDDLVLLCFQEVNTHRNLLKTQRDEPEWFRVYFTAPSSNIPTIQGLNFDATHAFIEQRSKGNDTITYWLRDLQQIPCIDTLQLAYTYLAYNDSTNSEVMRTDTLELIPKNTMARRIKKQEEEMKKWEKDREKRHKRGDYSQETPPIEYLKLEGLVGRIAPDQNLTIRLKEPAISIDTSRFHFFLKEDTLQKEAPFRIDPIEGQLLEYSFKAEWRPGKQYTLTIDSAAIKGLSGKVNKKTEQNITIPKMEEFGAIFFLLPDADSCARVQLLSGKDKIYRQVPITHGRADFFYLPPGNYYARIFYDRNGNGTWDTGCYSENRQAEEVYYFPQQMEVRANWDIEQTWRIQELPLTQQKPQELIKQKEDTKKKSRELNKRREQERGRR